MASLRNCFVKRRLGRYNSRTTKMYRKTNDLWPRGDEPAKAFCGEDERLSVLAAHGADTLVDDTELAAIVSLAAKACDTPIALVSIVERDRQFFLARLGLDALETPRPTSFCAHAMLGSEALVIPDATKDARFADNPLVTGAPHIRFYAGYPLITAEGAPIGSLCVISPTARPEGLNPLQHETLAVLAQAVMRRLSSQRQHANTIAAQTQTQKRVQQVLDSVPGIAWSADADLNFDYFNARWHEVTGAESPRTLDEWASFVHPEDFAKAKEKFLESVVGKQPYEGEFRVQTATGDWRWMQASVVPVETDSEGLRWVGTLIDNDREHTQREANDLLAKELSHRIKNIFAVISGLVAIRSRGKAEVADFAKELGAAIRALGTAHDYVRPMEGRNSSECLQGLMRDLLAPYDDGTQGRITIRGDDIPIGIRAATPLALIFHELATNSAKYGALGSNDGRVTVEIASPCEGDDRICVTWHEDTVVRRTSDQESHEGFGSRLLRMAIEGQLGGKFGRKFTDERIEIDISFPAARITD